MIVFALVTAGFLATAMVLLHEAWKENQLSLFGLVTSAVFAALVAEKGIEVAQRQQPPPETLLPSSSPKLPPPALIV